MNQMDEKQVKKRRLKWLLPAALLIIGLMAGAGITTARRGNGGLPAVLYEAAVRDAVFARCV